MTPAIRTRGLHRRFPGGHGVHGLDLTVPAGSIYGFLGPNGAGKTTTIRLLLDLLRRDAGSIELFGLPLDRALLGRIGALVESPSLHPHLSGRQNLDITRRLIDAPRARVDEALARVELREHADRRVREYSLGMRQRLAIALSLLGRPDLLILDEPSNGLDPAGILDMRRLLRTLSAEDGLTVFVSSHLLSEIEQIASHVGVLHAGRMKFEGTLDALRERARPRLTVRCDAPERAERMLAGLGEQVDRRDDGLLIVSSQQRDTAEINRLLVQQGIGVSHLAREQVSLESLFFDVIVDGSGGDGVLERAA
jgi:ABC-2 type transport system ATP-binding protein